MAIGPVFDFFDGDLPQSPSVWAEASEPQGPDGALLITSLHIKDIHKLNAASYHFQNGVRADPELDPTRYFVDDLPLIEKIGNASSINIRWAETDSDSSWSKDYFDDMIFPDGSRILGNSLAFYFSIMREVIDAGGFEGIANLDNDSLSESMLWIGFHIYMSDSHILSEKPRLLILLSTWSRAIQIRELHLRATGNEMEAEVWKQRNEDLYIAYQFMERRRLKNMELLGFGG